MPLPLPGKYARAGAGSDIGHQIWTREEIRHRLAEAAATIRRLPLPKYAKPAAYRTAWPDVAYDWLTYASDHTHLERIPPTPFEISRMDEALGWLLLLSRQQRLILWGRANHWSWAKLAELDDMEQNGKGRRPRQLRNINDDGEARVLAHLTDQPRRMVLQSHSKARLMGGTGSAATPGAETLPPAQRAS